MSGTLNFRYFPATTWRAPGFYAEFDASQANTASAQQRALLIGQILPTGTAVVNVPVQAFSQAQVDVLCGPDSMLALQYAAYRLQDAFGAVWLLPLADAGTTMQTSAAQGTTGVTLSFPSGTLGDVIVGETVAGTGLANGTTVAAVNDLAGTVTLSAATTAPVASGAAIVFGTGGAAAGSIALSGTATAAGTLSLYLMGVLVPVGVNAGDTAAVIATNLSNAINAAAGVCAKASVSGSTVAVTALHSGAALNDLDIRLNYRAVRNGEATPAGLGVVITPMTGGTVSPSLHPALDNLGTRTFDFIAVPYTDATSMTAIANLLSDQSGRWSAIEGLYGHAFYAYRGTISARSTFGASNNNQHETILGYYNSPTPAWLEAADWAGAHAAVLRTNPAIGVVGQPLNLLPPPLADQDTPAEMNVLLYDGLSTFTVDEAGQSRIGRSITSYQENQASQPDDSYLNTNLLFQAMYVARYLTANALTQFQNKVLVDDGTPIGPGSPATTPSLVFLAVCGMYAYLSSQFVVQNPDVFAKNGYGRKGQKGQVLLYLPIDFSDQIIQVAALIQFQQTT